MCAPTPAISRSWGPRYRRRTRHRCLALVVDPEKGCSALRAVRSNWRQMLRSTPLSRLMVRRSAWPVRPLTRSDSVPQASVPVTAMPVWK